MAKITCLGAGTWGFALATLLSRNGHNVTVWGRNRAHIEQLRSTGQHPRLPQIESNLEIYFTSDLNAAVDQADMVVESVTASGIRQVLEQLGPIDCPLVLTSKGIEQGSGLLLTEVAVEVMGEAELVGCLSGPSHAEEVVKGLPTSVVAAAYSRQVMDLIVDSFTAPGFRVYPNPDVNGVAFAAALKNPLAIACGISDGLGLGDNAKAALMTRGLHEMRKLAAVKGCDKETLNGLAGLGDLAVTCLSTHSRNYRFGQLVALGKTLDEAQEEVGMVVEGAYSCLSAVELAQQAGIPVPIIEGICEIVYGGAPPLEVAQALMGRVVKDEHL